MKSEWTLAELLALNPELDPYSGAVLRCVRPAKGQGRYIKETVGQRQFAHVKLEAWPSSVFSLSCRHQWPKEVPLDEADALDLALLRGVLEGAGRVEHPPWRSRIACTSVEYVHGATSVVGVSVAASLAVSDLVDTGQWVIDGEPPEELA